MIGTILSELHLGLDYLLTLNVSRLSILYQEALRQRTNKALMNMELLGMHRIQSKSRKDEVANGYKKLANPHNIKKDTSAVEITNSWNSLRSR